MRRRNAYDALQLVPHRTWLVARIQHRRALDSREIAKAMPASMETPLLMTSSTNATRRSLSSGNMRGSMNNRFGWSGDVIEWSGTDSRLRYQNFADRPSGM
jgi:hypothetical protein